MLLPPSLAAYSSSSMSHAGSENRCLPRISFRASLTYKTDKMWSSVSFTGWRSFFRNSRDLSCFSGFCSRGFRWRLREPGLFISSSGKLRSPHSPSHLELGKYTAAASVNLNELSTQRGEQRVQLRTEPSVSHVVESSHESGCRCRGAAPLLFLQTGAALTSAVAGEMSAHLWKGARRPQRPI